LDKDFHNEEIHKDFDFTFGSIKPICHIDTVCTGELYKAFDDKLNHEVTVKLIPHTKNINIISFLEEINAINDLVSNSIHGVYDAGFIFQ